MPASLERTVALLRDLSQEHAAAAHRMVGTPELATRETGFAIAAAGGALREIEDRALMSLCALARASGEDLAFEAVRQAHADWLRAVILNRAIETTIS